MDKLLDVSIELKMQAKMINKDSIKSANQATMQKKQIKEVTLFLTIVYPERRCRERKDGS